MAQLVILRLCRQLLPRRISLPMPDSSDKTKPWAECPDGLISQAADRRPACPIARRQRVRFRFFSLGLLLGTCMMVFGYWVTEPTPDRQQSPGVVNCEFVQSNLRAFCNDNIRDTTMQKSICRHINWCNHCRKSHQKVSKSYIHCPNRPKKVTVKPSLSGSRRR